MKTKKKLDALKIHGVTRETIEIREQDEGKLADVLVEMLVMYNQLTSRKQISATVRLAFNHNFSNEI